MDGIPDGPELDQIAVQFGEIARSVASWSALAATETGSDLSCPMIGADTPVIGPQTKSPRPRDLKLVKAIRLEHGAERNKFQVEPNAIPWQVVMAARGATRRPTDPERRLINPRFGVAYGRRSAEFNHHVFG